MNNKINNLKLEQLDWIIQSNTLLESVKNSNYCLLEYLFNSLIEKNYQDEELKEIIKSLEESFDYAKKDEITFINNYIDSLSKSIYNNDIINEFVNNKEYNEIIYNLLIICREYNIYNIKDQQKYIRATIEELKNRKDYFNQLFLPYSGCSALERIVIGDFAKYIVENNSEEFDYSKYNKYLESKGRERYISYILGVNSSEYIRDNYYDNLLNYPFKPNVEGKLKSYLLSLIMDYFYTYNCKYNNEPMTSSIEILNYDEEEIKSCQELLRYSIDEKTVDQIKKTYNNLCSYRDNAELLNVISLEPFYQNQDNISILKSYEDILYETLKNSDILPLNHINYKQMSTKMKKNIQNIWYNTMHHTIYQLFSCWLINYDDLFLKVYEKNKKEFMNTINNSYNFNYSEEEIYEKLKQSIEDTTKKYLEENEELIFKNINKETLKKITIDTQSEKELVLYSLKYLLSGITKKKYKKYREEIEQKVSFNHTEMDETDIIRLTDEMYKISDEFLYRSNLTYFKNIPISSEQKKKDFSYTSLLERNVKILEDLHTLTEEMNLASKGVYCYLSESPALNVQADIVEDLALDMYIRNAFDGLEDKLSVIEKEQQKMDFFTFINNYFQIIGVEVIFDSLREKLIECFYNEYSNIMYNLPEYDDKLSKYLISEAKNYIYSEIKSKNDIDQINIINSFNNHLISAYSNYTNINSNKTLCKSENK